VNVVVDANIVVKWYVAEPDWARAQLVLKTEGPIIAPGHILGEVGEVLV
jgi:predicted nucleic acid-binding protein